MTFTGYKGAAKGLDDIDPPRIGATIGVGEDEIHAFMDVEASGAGFDAEGRVKMLFEPHIFWRELGPGKARDLAASKGLAYEKWKPGAYPRESYTRLSAAMAINETAALRSASWGLGQIMGFNHVAAGYATPQDMVTDFAADEDNQIEAMIRFITAKGLAAAIRAHDWQKIETVYNGGGHGGAYAVKMAAAYDRWRKIKDTPWPQTAPQEPSKPETPPVTVPVTVPVAGKGIAAAVMAIAAAVAAVVAYFFGVK